MSVFFLLKFWIRDNGDRQIEIVFYGLISGLVRTSLNGDSSTNCVDMNARQLSLASISSEYTEDEKHQRDNSTNEKHSNIAMVAPTYSSLARNIVRSHTTLVSGAKTIFVCFFFHEILQIVNFFVFRILFW